MPAESVTVPVRVRPGLPNVTAHVESQEATAMRNLVRMQHSDYYAAAAILQLNHTDFQESAARVPGTGVNAHASRFVDDQEIVVFIEHVERDCFGFGLQWRAGASFDADRFATVQFLRGFHRCAVD